ncbi:unnamed protein product, partial [Ascophyllum nodosum]
WSAEQGKWIDSLCPRPLLRFWARETGGLPVSSSHRFALLRQV